MTRSNNLHVASLAAAVLLTAAPAIPQTPVEVFRVTAKSVEREVKLPGEVRPYLVVPIYAKIGGFVKRVDVDRGSTVRQGQLLATLEAPEMQTEIVEAESRAQVIELQRAEAVARS